MTKTQDELLAAVFSEIEQRVRNMPDAPYRDTYVAAMNEAWLLFEQHVAALRSPDPEVERLRGALQFYADEPAREFPSDGPWGVNSDDFGRVARAALSSNSGGR